MSLRIGVLGLGSVFLTPYRTLIERLAAEGRSWSPPDEIDPGKREAVGRKTGADVSMDTAEALIARDDIDVVLVLTSMNEHGALALAALANGKHVLVEKPMATDLEEARRWSSRARASAG